MPVAVKLFSAGECVQAKSLALQGAAHQYIRFPALFAFIQHTQAGGILFDTGYSTRFYNETRHFPFSIYSRVTPVLVKEEDGAAAQLRRNGIDPADIRHIVLSHFHPDHIGGIRDFPDACFWFLKPSYERVKGKKGWAALTKGFLPGLMPDDFIERARHVDNSERVDLEPELLPFEKGYDLLGDRSLIAVELPGHVQGHLGLIVNSGDGVLFFVGDACWLSEAYRCNRLPHFWAGAIFSSRNEYRVTLGKIHQLHRNNPSVRIIPSHCPEILEARAAGC